MMTDGTRRADIRPGIEVMVELVEHKRTGRLTGGKVKEILTSAPVHPHGIKVMLESGLIGRIKQIL
ncbi:MAG TPA: YwbE family protein [Bacteroidales bacterium]|nr:YwbE family protein [Bacteroidales bacterium]